MSRARYGHNVNASLIREIRMIAQEFFYTRRSTNNSIFNRSETKSSTLKCVFCMHVRKKPQDAITVMNGQAVCSDHEYYVRGGEFNKILAVIKSDEVRRKT